MQTDRLVDSSHVGTSALSAIDRLVILSQVVLLVYTKMYSRQTEDTVNYCVFINKLLELMGDVILASRR